MSLGKLPVIDAYSISGWLQKAGDEGRYTHTYLSTLTLASSGIIVTLLPRPAMSSSKVIKPGAPEKCQNRREFLRVAKGGCLPCRIPLAESFKGREGRLPAKQALLPTPSSC